VNQPMSPELAGTVPNFVCNKRANLAVRAIVQVIQAAKWPVRYLIDVAGDIDRIYAHSPRRFVWILRENGSDVYLHPTPEQTQPLESFDAHVHVFGKGDSYWVYDEFDVQPHDEYNQPHLRRVSAEYAREFLCDVIREYNES
jgi:hypothetical protein